MSSAAGVAVSLLPALRSAVWGSVLVVGQQMPVVLAIVKCTRLLPAAAAI